MAYSTDSTLSSTDPVRADRMPQEFQSICIEYILFLAQPQTIRCKDLQYRFQLPGEIALVHCQNDDVVEVGLDSVQSTQQTLHQTLKERIFGELQPKVPLCIVMAR